MGRPRKNPNYNAEEINANLISSVVKAYNHPTEDGKPVQLKILAAKFGITPPKVRKILITGGVYTSPIMVRIHELYHAGYSVEEIQQMTGLSRSSVHSYLPYSKTVYKTNEISVNAERIRLFRERQQAVEQMKKMYEGIQGQQGSQSHLTQVQKNVFWNTADIFQKYVFNAMTEEAFSYMLLDKEVIFEKTYAVDRTDVEDVLERVMLTQDLASVICQEQRTAPERWRYLRVVFQRIGILHEGI